MPAKKTARAQRAELLERIEMVSRKETPPEETIAIGLVVAALSLVLEELDSTRWHPTGDLKEWRKTPEGKNYAAVTTALKGVQSAQALAISMARARVAAVLGKPAKNG